MKLHGVTFWCSHLHCKPYAAFVSVFPEDVIYVIYDTFKCSDIR